MKKGGIAAGDKIFFKIGGYRAYPRIEVAVVEVQHFESCRDMLIAIGVKAFLPWRKDGADIDGAVQEYESLGEGNPHPNNLNW